MIKNIYGEMIWDQDDLCDLIMRGQEPWLVPGVTVDTDVDIEDLAKALDDPAPAINTWHRAQPPAITQQEFDRQQQRQWHMPPSYRECDIAALVLDRCQNQAQLQRAGQELLLFQERDMMDLLRYLHYLVTVMRDAGLTWGVGRGSSVASYVLYLLGVHKVDSLYYDLDPREFLR